MQILYLADTRFPIERANGLQTMATCHGLAARGHEVTLVVRPSTTPVEAAFTFYGLTPEPRLRIEAAAAVEQATARRVQYLLRAVRRARRWPGVVMTRDLGVASVLLQTPLLGTRLVYESHGLADVMAAERPSLLGGATPAPTAAKLARLARREAIVWRRSASYVTITRALADDLRARLGDRSRVFVVPDGAVVGPVAEAAAPQAPGEVVVGYAGHLYPWKGVDVLLTALARVPEARAIIVGGHPAEADRARIDRLIDGLGLANRVTMLGHVAPHEVARALAPATVLVLPNVESTTSARYTSPLKLFEYLALGRPIVASNLPAIREVLTDGSTALLVPPGDSDALAAAIDGLRRVPELRAKLAEAARRLAPDYSWARRAERIEVALEAARS